MQTKEATLTEIKSFFGFSSPTEFKDSWVKLNEEERKYFKVAVGQELHPEGQ
jgi:hypothetical protein